MRINAREHQIGDGAAASATSGARPAAELQANVLGAPRGGLAWIIEDDPLRRLHVAAAAAGLGFAVGEPSGLEMWPDEPLVVFVGLDSLDHCARCGATPRENAEAARSRRPHRPGADLLTVGYASGSEAQLAAHARHACTDVLVRLQAGHAGAVFAYPGPAELGAAFGAGLPADVTAREADVLLLILAGYGTSGIAARLWLSPATVRSHCRALLRKCGAANRRALRAQLLGAAGRPAPGPHTCRRHDS